MRGIDKRCGCRDESGRKLGAQCPLLERSGHGTYGYRIDLGPGLDAKGAFRTRRQEYHGGFSRRKDVERAKAEHLTRLARGEQQARSGLTCSQWLHEWLEGKVNLRPATRRSYESHLRLYLDPYLGAVRLQDLTPSHIERMYAAVRERRTEHGKRRTGPTTVRRLHATLMSALNTAVKRRLLPYNPAQHVELEAPVRVELHPWSAVQLGAFLDAVASDRLFALYQVLAVTGLRRGEAVGLRWEDVDLDAHVIRVRQTITDVGGTSVIGRPKTRGSERLVDVDAGTMRALVAHRRAQEAERQEWGAAWNDTGLVFTREERHRPSAGVRHPAHAAGG